MKTATATATTSGVDQTKIQKITNNSGVDVSVCLPLTSAETENSPGALISYNKDFVILAVANSGTTLKSGATGTVTLDRSYIDPTTKETEYSTGYDLLFNTVGWLTPVDNQGVVQDFDEDTNIGFYDDVTVTAAAKTAMQQTADFYQTVAAYPDSQLAQDYVNAMSGTSSSVGTSTTSADIAKSVAAFFKGTKSYQQVTMATIVALKGYYDRFPFIWASYTNTATYYLYSSDGTKTSFQGTLSISKTGDVDITKPNGGYTCQFVPAVNSADTTSVAVNTANAKTLTYSDGLFVDDLNTDLPTVALKGSFQLKRTFTKDPNDTKIMVVITGTVNGMVAVGFDQTQCTKADNTTQDWLNSLFHPKTAAEIFNSVMQILGALMMLHFVVSTLWGIGKWIKEKTAGGKQISDTDLANKKTELENDFKTREGGNLKKASASKESLPDTAEQGLSNATTSKGTLSDTVSAGQAESGLIKMKNNLKDLENYVMDDTTGTVQTGIDGASREIRDTYSKINTSELADLKATLAELRPQLQELSGKVTELNTTLQKMVANEQQAAMDENVKDMQTVQDDFENESKTNENEGSDGTNDDPDADGMEFPDL